MNEDDYLDALYEDQHRKRLHRRLMNLPFGHPDEDDLMDAIEEANDD